MLHNIAFVTSTGQPAGSLGGLAGADAICRARATAGGLPGTFVAWLSSSAANARDRLGTARGWIRRDGLPVADRISDLVGNRMLYPIVVDEFGASAFGSEPAMGTRNGVVDGTNTCADYTSTTGQVEIGIAASSADQWTSFASTVCTFPLSLYCLQTDYSEPLLALPGTSRRAFETTAAFSPTSGIAGADALCTNDATVNMLAGSFHALLATTSATAASRFTVGTAWSRRDGVILTTDFTSSMSGLDVTAAGVYRNSEQVFLGAPDATTLGTAATTCGNWSTMGGTADVAFSSYSGPTWLATINIACATFPSHILCLQD